jgi:hypothetical protein
MIRAFLLWATILVFPIFPVTAQDLAPSFLDQLFPRGRIDTRIVGVNSFANDGRFGSVRAQYREARRALGLKFVRVAFHWNDSVQPTPRSPIDFSFYDEIARNLPRDVQAVVVLTHVPSWMQNRRNWIDGDPRRTFVEKWVKPVVSRYRRNGRLRAYQIWNEPNDESNPSNTLLGLRDTPANYLEMLTSAAAAMESIAPRKRVVGAATTAINQNYPETFNYNKDLWSLGIGEVTDIFAVHIYGKNFERFLIPGGIEDFLNTVTNPIWITESGSTGINSQLAYVEQMWTFLKERVPNIQRFYFYQHTEATPASSTYGLRNLTPGFLVSDLFLHLRSRVQQSR